MAVDKLEIDSGRRPNVAQGQQKVTLVAKCSEVGGKERRFRRRAVRIGGAVPRLGISPPLGPTRAVEPAVGLVSPFPTRGADAFRDSRKNTRTASGADRRRGKRSDGRGIRVVLNLQEEIALAEHVRVGVGRAARFVVAVGQQDFRDVAAQTAMQVNERAFRHGVASIGLLGR